MRLFWAYDSHLFLLVRGPLHFWSFLRILTETCRHGWTAQYHVHWIVPIAALAPFGLGLMGILAPLQTYMIDCFPQYAASAVAGMSALRCLLGAVLPLAGPPLYQHLGLGWGNSLLGFIALLFAPVPMIVIRVGARYRARMKVAHM